MWKGIFMIKSIGTHIKAKDYKASRAFYEGFGFPVIFEYGPDKEVKEEYSGVTFAVGAAKLEVADGHRAVKPKTFKEQINSSKISLMVEVESLGEVIERGEKLGLTPTTQVRHYYWGKLEVVYRDPDGVIVVFTQSYNPEDAKKLRADETWGKISVK
jgi:catechol 2,3-dioxygenase-like lactoylglutathione lyase family enzyme